MNSMFSKLLVANRGEIAVRIINECKRMGIKTVAICSDIDRNALHMQDADEGYCIGAAPMKDSYMNIEAIINAAIITGSDAIHPGYGFLSENAEFAKACEQNHISFVGSSSDTIRQSGDKATAKQVAVSQYIPIAEGELIDNLNDALLQAKMIGYPVMLKINDGGGGAGMKPVFSDNELKSAFEMLHTPKNRVLLIEKYVTHARHIEIQIIADNYGNIVTLGNRECSVQLDNKKVVEECPANNLSKDLLSRLYYASLKFAKAINFIGAGTVEFLVDEDENYYFLEMNARIQVEHGITEMITGINLIQWQIKIAEGEKFPFVREDIGFSGHALECRINAQSCGVIDDWNFSNKEARFDHSLAKGIAVTPYYDPLLGKLISHGQTRADAINKMREYLEELQISGVKTNIELHKKILNNTSFLNGRYLTNFLKKERLCKGDRK